MVINIQAKPQSQRSKNAMNEYPKNNNCDVKSMSRPVTSRPSLFEKLDAVKEKVGFDDFAKPLPNGKTHVDPLIEEICLIIAEVLIRPCGRVMRIRGQEIEAGVVQEVYEKLTHEHIELVADNFKKQTRLIRNKSAYLQTALYNSVFEFHSHYTNLVAHDWH